MSPTLSINVTMTKSNNSSTGKFILKKKHPTKQNQKKRNSNNNFWELVVVTCNSEACILNGMGEACMVNTENRYLFSKANLDSILDEWILLSIVSQNDLTV